MIICVHFVELNDTVLTHNLQPNAKQEIGNTNQPVVATPNAYELLLSIYHNSGHNHLRGQPIMSGFGWESLMKLTTDLIFV